MRLFSTVVGAVAGVLSLQGAFAQTQTVPRVGFVAGAGGYPKMAVTNQAFFDGLSNAGYKDGSTLTVVFRTAEGNMSLMPELIGGEGRLPGRVQLSWMCGGTESDVDGAGSVHLSSGQSSERGADDNARARE